MSSIAGASEAERNAGSLDYKKILERLYLEINVSSEDGEHDNRATSRLNVKRLD